MDFGIAARWSTARTQTAAGSVIGTLSYMAPEQAQGSKVDQRADHYAFGLILYDMLLGRKRLAKRDNPMTELLARLTAVAAGAAHDRRRRFPSRSNEIVMRCLQPAPDDALSVDARSWSQALERADAGRHDPLRVHEVIVHDAPARPKWPLAAAASGHRGSAGAGGWVSADSAAAPAPVLGRARPVSVLIADFENKTGDPVFDGVVEQALGLGIESASFVTAYPRRDALRVAGGHQAGREARRADGAPGRVARRRQR